MTYKHPYAGLAAIVVLLTTISGEARAMDKPIHTRDLITLSGKYAGPGVVCPQFRLEDGETISLSGDFPSFENADEPIVLTGRWALQSKCMQGREFRVFK